MLYNLNLISFYLYIFSPWRGRTSYHFPHNSPPNSCHLYVVLQDALCKPKSPTSSLFFIITSNIKGLMDIYTKDVPVRDSKIKSGTMLLISSGVISTKEASFLGGEVFSFPINFHFFPRKRRSSKVGVIAQKPSFSSPESKNLRKRISWKLPTLMWIQPLGQILKESQQKKSSLDFSQIMSRRRCSILTWTINLGGCLLFLALLRAEFPWVSV